MPTENSFKFDEKGCAYSFLLISAAVPLVTPENFHLVSDSLNSTNAMFRWEPVDTSPDNIRGFFRGYQVSLDAEDRSIV